MKRVNVRFVTILFLAVFVGTLGWYALFRFQRSRQTGGLLRIADQQIAENHTDEAIRSLLLYIRRQKDDTEQVNRLAMLARDHAFEQYKKGSLDPRKWSEAYSVLEECTRRCPEDIEVQEAMVNFLMSFNATSDAIDYLERLIAKTGDDAKPVWRLQLAAAYHRAANYDKSLPLLAQIVGWNSADETFDLEKALSPEEVDAYSVLATILRDQRQSPRQADKVIEQMVAQNPEDHRSYIARIRYLQSGINPPKEAIEEDIRKALSLAPDAAEPLIFAGNQAMQEKDFIRAQALFSQARDLHPSRLEPLIGLFECAYMQGDAKKGLTYIEDGLKLNPGSERLLFVKATVQLDAKDFVAFEKTFEEYQRVAGGNPRVEYLRGRRHILEGEWLPGSRILSEVRHQLQLYEPQLLESVDRSLAMAYGNLNQLDRQLESYNNILQLRPDDVYIRAMAIQCMYSLKQDTKAKEAYQALLRGLAADPEGAKTWAPVLVQLEITYQQNLPASERDWSKAEALTRQVIELPNVDPVFKRSIAADILRLSGRNNQADALLKDVDLGETNNALAQFGDLGVRIRELPLEQGLKEIDQFEQEAGLSLPTLLLRAEAIALHKPEDAEARLKGIEDSAKSLDAKLRQTLWIELGRYYLLAGLPQGTERLWKQAIDDNPNDVQQYVRILELAGGLRDTEQVESIVKKMEERLGRDAAEAKWGRAYLLLSQVIAEKAQVSQLDAALTLLADAKEARSGWPNLYLLEGDIRNLQGRPDLALQAFESAQQLGSNSPEMLKFLVRMYYEQKRMDKAHEVLRQLPQQFWTDVEKQIEVYVLASRSELPEKIDLEKTARSVPELLALSRVLADVGRGDEALQAARKALELEPESPPAWSVLFFVTRHFSGPDEARAVLDAAKEKVTQENARLTLLTTSYRVLGDFDAAEPLYLEFISKNPDDPAALADIAGFYIDFKKFDQARPYLDRILKDQEPNQASAPPQVRWARRMQAIDASQSGDYEGYRRAVELIEQNSPAGGVLAADDLTLLGQLTTARPEAPSHQNLLKHLQKASESRQLNFDENLLLANASFSAGDWRSCESIMSDMLAKDPSDIRVLEPWLRFLLQRGDLQGASHWIKNCPADSMAALRTRVHLDVRRGHTDRAIETLKQILSYGDTPEQQQEQLRLVATLANELGAYDAKMYDAAESSWKRLASLNPNFKPNYAQYLVQRNDPKKIDTIMTLCQELVNDGRQGPGMQLATIALSNLPKSAPNRDKYISQLGQWLDNVDISKVDSGAIAIQRAEFEALRGRADQQEQILRDYLVQNSKKDRSRGTVLNNLAYMMAIKGRGEEAQQLIDEAIEILGPISSLHDTIGVVRLAQGDAAGAVAEFQGALDQGETSPVVYLHLAVAHWKAGNQDLAINALRKGQEAGLDEGNLGPWEQPMLRQLVQDLKDAGISLETLEAPVHTTEAPRADAT